MSGASAEPASPPSGPAALSARTGDLDYSVRRFFVDEFFTRHAGALAPGSRVIDLGGVRGPKRGQFDIEKLPLNLVCVNIAAKANPDVRADAAEVPLPGGEADAVILAEVVEHLIRPEAVLAEAARLLRPGGVLLATAPFLFRVHPDPIDVARYTAQWWSNALDRAGFTSHHIEPQGAFFSVIAEFVRGWVKHLADTGTLWPGARDFAPLGVRWLRERAFEWDASAARRGSSYEATYTTGFGVRAVRA